MSDEIVDVKTFETGETITDDGLNIPSKSVVEEFADEESSEILKRREEINNILPEYPKEWQEQSSLVEEIADDTSTDTSVKVSYKEEEIKKIIKKYKRYLRSNIREIRKLENPL